MADLAYFNQSGQWNIMKTDGTVITTGVVWGQGGDLPAPGDYDGDGTCDLATWRLADGRWRIQGVTSCWYGQKAGMYPVPGDYDGDGTTDIAFVWPVVDGGTDIWYVRNIRNQAWMTSDGIPIPLDYDGDGTTDLGVYRTSNQVWAIRHLSAAGTYYFPHWGIAGDTPLVGDFDGDGSADVAIWRWRFDQSWWWIRYSSQPSNYSNFTAHTGDSIVTGAASY